MLAHFAEFLRGIVRPVVLLGALAATVAFLWTGRTVPEAWWTLLGTVVAYFFMQRQQAPPSEPPVVPHG